LKLFFYHLFSYYKYKNLTVVYAQQYGQVYQRIVGFKHAKGDYVLQLDDDILLLPINFNYILFSIIRINTKISACTRYSARFITSFSIDYLIAYCEDLIHSFLLRKLGVDLFVNTRAKCATPINPRLSLLKEIVPDFKIRLYFVKIAGLSVTRMLLYYIVYIMRAIIK
jgi:glycosyltransferase involved in cell wall biosynthesis